MKRLLSIVLLLIIQFVHAEKEITVASIGFAPIPSNIRLIPALVENEAKKGTDLIILPEAMFGKKPYEKTSEMLQCLAQIAKEYNTYIICPIYRYFEKYRLNSAILFDRNGEVISPIYNKIYPFWQEYTYTPPVIPPSSPQAPIYETDFGRIGICICFDINFPDVWKQFADAKVDLVAWSSAYSGGSLLQSYALQHHYYIVSATSTPDCMIIDIDGSETLYQRSNNVNVTRAKLDLDRCIFHRDFNGQKLEKLLKEHENKIAVDKTLKREYWFILKSLSREISARQTASLYGLEELSDYIQRSHREINAMRDKLMLEF